MVFHSLPFHVATIESPTTTLLPLCPPLPLCHQVNNTTLSAMSTNNFTPTPLIKQGHGISRANFAVNLNYVGAVIIGPIIIFVLGLISWIFVFWMTGLSLRFCRPKCGKLMLELCIVNRQKNPKREENIVWAFNVCLILGFITNMLSFIGNVSLDKAFNGFTSNLKSFNSIFNGQMQPAANLMYQQTLRLQTDFGVAYPDCTALGRYLFKVNSFVANTNDLQASIGIISSALSYVATLMVTGLQAKNALFYTIWIFLLVSIALLKIFQSMKTCGRAAKTAIMAFVITTFFLILLGCFVFMLTASGASDICMNPTQSAISILPPGGSSNQTAQDAFQFYSSCTGNDPIGNQVKTTYDNIAYLNSSFQYQYRYTSCFRQTHINTMLSDLSGINQQFIIIDLTRQCRPVQKIWLDLQNTLCTDLFTGAYSLWLTMLFATVFVYCAFLLAAVDQYERVLDFSEYLDQIHGDLQEFDGVKPEDLVGDEENGRRSPSSVFGSPSYNGSQRGGSQRGDTPFQYTLPTPTRSLHSLNNRLTLSIIDLPSHQLYPFTPPSHPSPHPLTLHPTLSPFTQGHRSPGSVNSSHDAKAASLSSQNLFKSPSSSSSKMGGALSTEKDNLPNPLNTPNAEGKDFNDDNCTTSATPPTPGRGKRSPILINTPTHIRFKPPQTLVSDLSSTTTNYPIQ